MNNKTISLLSKCAIAVTPATILYEGKRYTGIIDFVGTTGRLFSIGYQNGIDKNFIFRSDGVDMILFDDKDVF